jgi:hypothetical protein
VLNKRKNKKMPTLSGNNTWTGWNIFSSNDGVSVSNDRDGYNGVVVENYHTSAGATAQVALITNTGYLDITSQNNGSSRIGYSGGPLYIEQGGNHPIIIRQGGNVVLQINGSINNHASNQAAKDAGLTNGTAYHTDGILKIVY